MLGDPDAAERALAETVVTAWRERGLVENATTVRIWLYRIATRICEPLSNSDEFGCRRPFNDGGP